MFFQINMSDERVQAGAAFYQPLRDWLVANDAPDVDHIDTTTTLWVWDWIGGCREIKYTVFAVNEDGKYYLCPGECPCGEAHHVAKRIVSVPLTVRAPDSLRSVMIHVHEDKIAS